MGPPRQFTRRLGQPLFARRSFLHARESGQRRRRRLAAEHTEFLKSRGIDVSGIQVVPAGKSFRWTGRYKPNMNDRETLDIELDVFGTFEPKLSEAFRRSPTTYSSATPPRPRR